MATTSKSKRCRRIKRDGKQCRGFAVRGSGGFCLTHSPKHANKRRARNAAGGRARAVPKASAGSDAPRIEGTGDVILLVNWVIADTWNLENSAPRSRALLAACAQAIACLEIGDLEERVRLLEQRLEVKP